MRMDSKSLSMAVRKGLVQLCLNRPDSTNITAISPGGVIVTMPGAEVQITPEHLRVKAVEDFHGRWESLLDRSQFPGHEVLAAIRRKDPLFKGGFGPEAGEWSNIEMPPELFDLVWWAMERHRKSERRQSS